MFLDRKERYFQLAFNRDIDQLYRVVPHIPHSPRIFIEVGTPLLKREGMRAVRIARSLWKGSIIADLKISDGAIQEVDMAVDAGANGVTALLSAPLETLNLFVARCRERGAISMIDTLGGGDPLKKIRQMRFPPDIVILHRGRDEENVYGKLIEYKHISRLKSKYALLISVAGGVDLKQARSAVFNGANIVVGNVVSSSDPWAGLSDSGDIRDIVQKFLETVQG
ncbi:MAG: hypothetical protein JXR30_02610 [Alphaproteobacteria bacterium]|nr:hypothetical protein [Alphaproteobacteria bacterium]